MTSYLANRFFSTVTLVYLAYKIIQITAVPKTGKQTTDSVYGLGEDNKIYWWNVFTGQWELAIADLAFITKKNT